MDKLEYRAVIKFCILNGLSPTEIYEKLLKVYKKSSPSYSTVKKWAAEFKRGRTSLVDDPREGRPKSATTEEKIKKVHNMVLNDRRLKVYEIADAVSISKDRVRYILYQELNMRKLCASWVPHSLTNAQKLMRKRISEQSVSRFKKNVADFMRRFVTMDQTWIYYYTQETKHQTKQRGEAGGSAPKKAKSILPAGKIMASVFWNAKGILFIDYLQRGETITDEYYASLLDQLDEKIREISGLQKRKIIFHQKNVLADVLSMGKLSDLKYELWEHPPFSPDLAPSDFLLFPDLMKFMAGKYFESNEEVIATVDRYFADLPESHFRDGIQLLEKRWTRCIELNGEYIE